MRRIFILRLKSLSLPGAAAPLFSSSSLRFCSEFDGINRADGAVAFGAGHNFEIEVIHPIEICARLMGCGAVKLETFGDKSRFIAHVIYSDGRKADIFYCQGCKGYRLRRGCRKRRHA